MWFRKKKEINVSEAQTRFLKTIQIRQRKIVIIQWMILISFFAIWELAASQSWIDPFIFSQPSRMLSSAIAMLKDGSLIVHIGTTFWETVAGFALGTILGTLIAILLWWNQFISDVAEPYLVILNSLPKTALAPIIIVWIGNNQKSIIFVALLTSVVVTIMSVLHGFLQMDQDKIKLIQIFGGTKLQVLTKAVFPANIPVILSALKINVGLSFVGVIVGEFLVAQSGLGFLIVYGSQVFKLDWVMLSVIILAIMAALMYKGIVLLEKKFLKWQTL